MRQMVQVQRSIPHDLHILTCQSFLVLLLLVVVTLLFLTVMLMLLLTALLDFLQPRWRRLERVLAVLRSPQAQ